MGGCDCSAPAAADRQLLRTGRRVVVAVAAAASVTSRHPSAVASSGIRRSQSPFTRRRRPISFSAERRCRQPFDGRHARPVSRRCDVQRRLADYRSNLKIRRPPKPLDTLVIKTLSLLDFVPCLCGLPPDG